jgi:hypothetical protein
MVVSSVAFFSKKTYLLNNLCEMVSYG